VACIHCTGMRAARQLAVCCGRALLQVEDSHDAAVRFVNFDAAQFRVAAGPGYAHACSGLEHRAVVNADQPVFLVGQEAVGRKVELPPLVRADIEPHARLAVVARGNEPYWLIVMIDLQLAILTFSQVFGRTQEHRFTHEVLSSMHNPWRQFYQPPQSPLARFGLALAAIGVLALSFILGLVFLAVATGLAVIGFVVLGIRRLLGGTRRREDGVIEVEYRVVDRRRDDQ